MKYILYLFIWKGLYRRSMTLLARSLSTPITMRSGDMKSLTAAPSFRNSGFEATSNSIFLPRFANSSSITALTFADVPTGTVDLVTSMVYFSMFCPNVLATDSTYFKSAEPSSSGGVPTAENTTSTSFRHDFRSVVKCNRPTLQLRLTISSRPGSYIGISPALRRSIFLLSMSTHVTLIPISEKQAPETSPT